MKTILITSSGFLKPSVIEEIMNVLPHEQYRKVAYIPTASKPVDDNSYAEKDVEIMQSLGMTVDTIDLEETKDTELEERLRSNDFIYVQGGNPYYLLKYARESGFMNIVPQLIEEGKPYVGKSAGAYILAPEVVVPDWFDPEKKNWNRNGVEDVQGMGVVDFVWAAHYSDELKKTIQEHVETSPYPVRALTNDQAFLILDDEVKLVGLGEEIKFEKKNETTREISTEGEIRV